MESREQRIATLAATLKSSGIAKSDSQSRMMAEEMIGVEEHVQRSYEEKHARATEYLQTAKNLGTPRQTVAPQAKSSEPAKKIEPLYTQSKPQDNSQRSETPKKFLNEGVTTDVDFGNKTLSQAVDMHDTHNPALEAIKNQMRQQKIVALEDMEQPAEKHFVEPMACIDIPSPVEPPAPEQFEEKSVEEISDSKQISESRPITPEETKLDEPKQEQPKLDAQKLIDMMEEDGKLEEHTREIKEKPKDVKPKEAYAENNIDLSNMFNFGKR